MKYRVRFWNPDKPGSGFIDAYSRAGAAKAAVEAYNALFAKSGNSGIRAQYLGAPRYDADGNFIHPGPLPTEPLT